MDPITPTNEEQISIEELADRSQISIRDIKTAIAKGTVRFKEWLKRVRN
jgi:hypothetical protein